MIAKIDVKRFIVPAIVTAVVFFLATRQNDQIGLLFASLSFPGQAILSVFILTCAGTSLQALHPHRDGRWPSCVDTLVYALPTIALGGVWLTSGALGAGTIAVLGIVVHLLSTHLIGRHYGTLKIAIGLAVATVLIWLAIHAAITWRPVDFPRQIGTIALTLLFLVLIAMALQLIIRFPRALGPFFAIVVVGFFFHEPVHRIDVTEFEVVGGEGEPASKIRSHVSLQQSFQTWLLSRNDLDEYKARQLPYPVFLVASQGGGGYAAAHADLFLTKLQARCPNFAQHTFATIGVSGGAIGNAMFGARLSADSNPEDYKGCEGAFEQEPLVAQLAADNLSPIVAALFFRDFPNKILFGAFGGGDRATALKSSIIDTLGGDATQVNPLSWEQYWAESEDGIGWVMGEKPAFVAVATNAFSGRRYVFAPFSFSFSDRRAEYSLLDLNQVGMHDNYTSSDVSVIDAAIASASFPYVTPSRVLGGATLVDGGYIENEGAETARDIVAELQSPNAYFDGATIVGMSYPRSYKRANGVHACDEAWPVYMPLDLIGDKTPEISWEDPCIVPFTVHIISIRAEVPQNNDYQAQSFFWDPIVSLLSARARRGEIARFSLLSQLCGAYNCPPQVEDATGWRLYESVIRTDALTLPLGWYLPKPRILALSHCVAPSPYETFAFDETPKDGSIMAAISWQGSKFSTMGKNPHVMQAIVTALSPEVVTFAENTDKLSGRCSIETLSESGTQ